MARYIDANKLCDSLRESYNRLFELYKKAKDSDTATLYEAELNTFMECVIRAKTQPTTDVVSVEAYKQVSWERDLAMEQLQSYGVGFGEDKELAEVKHGEWKGFEIPHMMRCSECGVSELDIHRTKFDYCPFCGAKMDGGNAE